MIITGDFSRFQSISSIKERPLIILWPSSQAWEKIIILHYLEAHSHSEGNNINISFSAEIFCPIIDKLHFVLNTITTAVTEEVCTA